MSSFLDKLNLRPQERRLIVVIAIVFFVVINIWLVWPQFKEWKVVQGKKWDAERTLKRYSDKIQKMPGYEAKLRDLENQGSRVLAENQALDLVNTVQNQSRASGLSITRSDSRTVSSNTKTNQFFDEQALSIQVDTGTEELVNFLVSVASTNSLIRVKEMDLRPHQNGYKLSGKITLVASYQKAAPKASPAPTKTAPVPAAKTAADTAAAQKTAAKKPAGKTGPGTGTNTFANHK